MEHLLVTIRPDQIRTESNVSDVVGICDVCGAVISGLTLSSRRANSLQTVRSSWTRITIFKAHRLFCGSERSHWTVQHLEGCCKSRQKIIKFLQENLNLKKKVKKVVPSGQYFPVEHGDTAVVSLMSIAPSSQKNPPVQRYSSNICCSDVVVFSQ